MGIKIIRKIDKLGRIVIPKDVRNSLDLNTFDDVEIRIEKDTIVLEKISFGEGRLQQR